MSEPYTDEEFEEVKHWFKKLNERSDAPNKSEFNLPDYPFDSAWDNVYRLIATVESLKVELKIEKCLTDKQLWEFDEMEKYHKEENAKLTEDNRLLGKLAKSNVETTRVQLDKNSELIEQNAKLKLALEASLKRIEEME